MEKIVGVQCKSGHMAAFGVTIHFSYVGSPKRPQPEEFEELMQNARKELDKDEFWDGLLKDLRRLDTTERKEREEWLKEKVLDRVRENYLMKKQEDTANADV